MHRGPQTLKAMFNELKDTFEFNYYDLLNPNSSQTFSVYLDGAEKIVGKLLKL
jgi:hypothetical protein